jgi:NAD(P)-dependent dehydrogenase (short-subunit alcohol dehydrogenase family)
MSEIGFEGRSVLVTGGAAGIGRAVAEAFAARGARVAVADLDRAALAETEAAFAARGFAPLLAAACDVRDTAAVEALVADVEARHGGLDVLVNNVGDIQGVIKPLERMSDEEIDAQYAVTLKHVFVVSRAAIPLLRRRAPGSSIVSISSIEGYRGLPRLVPYASFKLAIEGFTKSLALELGPDGIRVNAVAPETTETSQITPSKWIAPEHRERVRDWIPLGRFGRPSDVAGCTLFLASELAAWVTGTVVHCDGGALAAAGWYRTPEGRWTNTPIITGSGIEI